MAHSRHSVFGKTDCVPRDVSLCPGGGSTFVPGGTGLQASRLPPGLGLPPCWVCSQGWECSDTPHTPGTPSWVSVILLFPNLGHAGSAGEEPGSQLCLQGARQGKTDRAGVLGGAEDRAGPCAWSPCRGRPDSRRRPHSLLTTAPRLRLTLRVCLTLGVAGPQRRKEGRPSDRAWAREAGPRTHPKEAHLPLGPEALTTSSKQLPRRPGGRVLQRKGRGKDRLPARVQ